MTSSASDPPSRLPRFASGQSVGFAWSDATNLDIASPDSPGRTHLGSTSSVSCFQPPSSFRCFPRTPGTAASGVPAL